jgi:hypothetical protein
MTIRRKHITVYEEIDEGTSTKFPIPADNEENDEPDIEESTNIPDSDKIVDKGSNISKTSSALGRTFPDLIIEFINNIKVMTVILLFIPFPFFVSKINTYEDMKYPLLIGLGLNIVWYFITFINWLIKKIK